MVSSAADAGEESAVEAGVEGVAETVDASASVRAALDRVLASADFASSPRLAAFLRFVVETTLDGRADALKGYTIAVEALGRPPSFDPQSDPIVRVEATRLRRALDRYYATVGADDPVIIDVPKGGYVPQFRARGPDDAALADPDTSAVPPGSTEVPAEITRPRRLLPALAAGLAVVVTAGLGFALWDADIKAPRDAATAAATADRIRLPLVEVRTFEASGDGAPPMTELRAIEERMRDAFARFDFTQVRAAGADIHESAVAEACAAKVPRSVFSLAGLAEGRPDGTFSLAVRLTDRCDGSIVWSTMMDGLSGAGKLAESEQRVIHDVAVAVMEGYGVVQVRARAQALARAPASGYGCVAAAAAQRRSDSQETRPEMKAETRQETRGINVDECLAELTRRDPAFALGHAVRAETQLQRTLHDDTPAPSEAELEVMLDEAERAVELAPASAYAARALALVQLFAGEPDEAVTTAERALRLNPLDFDVAATVGVVFIGAGRIAEGEALLANARREGAVATPFRDSYLALAAFLRGDLIAAQAMLPQLTLHPTVENRIALALSLHALGRHSEEREVVNLMVHQASDGADGVRRLVTRLLPSKDHASRALAALESAGLSADAGAGKPPRG
ncbi:type IV pilus biogenesis/stability protein PilW [Xanthobacter aminoxidans]|uniref:type IV pilus biogenesis/stability protein PilW n=1 Tax=Xanthobacter aminoxidans TaxID=186280 RepID=UPI003727C465